MGQVKDIVASVIAAAGVCGAGCEAGVSVSSVSQAGEVCEEPTVTVSTDTRAPVDLIGLRDLSAADYLSKVTPWMLRPDPRGPDGPTWIATLPAPPEWGSYKYLALCTVQGDRMGTSGKIACKTVEHCADAIKPIRLELK